MCESQSKSLKDGVTWTRFIFPLCQGYKNESERSLPSDFPQNIDSPCKSLTTVGLGDFVPTTQPPERYAT